jgi:hypothetical protein
VEEIGRGLCIPGLDVKRKTTKNHSQGSTGQKPFARLLSS